MKQNQIRKFIYDKFNGHCAYCGCDITIKEMQVDHIIPKSFFKQCILNKQEKGFLQVPIFLNHLSENDVEHIDNKFPSCRVCNNYKSTCPIDMFRNELSKQITRLRKFNSNFRRAERYNLVEVKPINIVFYFEKITRSLLGGLEK